MKWVVTRVAIVRATCAALRKRCVETTQEEAACAASCCSTWRPRAGRHSQEGACRALVAQRFLPSARSTDPFFSQKRLRLMGFSTPHARPEHHHRARRRGAPRSLPALTAPDRSRKLAHLCPVPRVERRIRCRKLVQHPLGVYRLPGKPPPPLPRVAWWARATPTRPRRPSADGIARTPPPLCAQRRKAPAKAAARALPAPLRHHRPIASSS